MLVNLETFILQQKDSDHYQTLVTLISLQSNNDRMGEYPRDRLNSLAASSIVSLRNLTYKSVEEKYEGQD